MHRCGGEESVCFETLSFLSSQGVSVNAAIVMLRVRIWQSDGCCVWYALVIIDLHFKPVYFFLSLYPFLFSPPQPSLSVSLLPSFSCSLSFYPPLCPTSFLSPFITPHLCLLPSLHPPLSAACKDHRRALEVSQHSAEMGLILGVCAGGLVVLILLLGVIIIIIRKGWVTGPHLYTTSRSSLS